MCECGNQSEKSFRQIETSGGFCNSCQLEIKKDRMRKTLLHLYGADHPQKVKEIRKNGTNKFEKIWCKKLF